jgi:hypothetical protein
MADRRVRHLLSKIERTMLQKRSNIVHDTQSEIGDTVDPCQKNT